MDALVGMQGFSVYYHTLPKNKVNDWLVEEHKKRFNGAVPDLFTAGGNVSGNFYCRSVKENKR